MQCITRCILLYSFAYCVLYKIRHQWGTKAKMFNGWSSIQNTVGHIYLHVLFFTLLTWLLGQSEWLSVCRFQRESALTVTFIPGQAYFKKKNHKGLSLQRWNPQKGVCTELLLYCQWALRGFICSEKSAPESVSHHYPVPEPGSWPPPLFYGATETLGLLIYRHTCTHTNIR